MSRPQHSAMTPKAFLRSSLPHTAYQVDYAAVNCGRIVPASKRHIRFKFGYTNIDALSDGKTGQECRGSEHEISVTWSLSSGKQAIAFDQHEVFFDVGDSTQTKLSHAWKDARGHSLEVKIHAANMSTKSNPDPDWKQYDLIVDGVSFFHMPKIFEIGVFPKNNLAPQFAQKSARISSVAPPNAAGRLRNVSKSTMKQTLPPGEPKKQPESVEVTDLLSFDDIDAPAVAASVGAPPMQTTPVQTTYAHAQAIAQNNYAPAQARGQESYAFAQSPPQTNFAPAQAPAQINTAHVTAPVQSNYAPVQQTYAPSSNSFHNSHTQDRHDANCISPTTSPGQSGNNYMTPDQDPSAFYASGPQGNSHIEASNVAPTSSSYAPQPSPVTPPTSSTALDQPAPASYGVDGAMENLVNMDDLFGPAAAPITRESMDSKMEDANAHKSLGQLKGSNSRNAKNPVMNPFNSATIYEQQGAHNGYAAQQQQQQCNNYSYQQTYAQPGFGYQ